LGSGRIIIVGTGGDINESSDPIFGLYKRPSGVWDIVKRPISLGDVELLPGFKVEAMVLPLKQMPDDKQ
jgi:hypothetical protein